MNIFISFQQANKKHNIPAYNFWELYIKRGIEEAGHEWVEAPNVDWAEGLSYNNGTDLNSWLTYTWNMVTDEIKELHRTKPIDLFLGYLYPQQIDTHAVNEIKSLGIPCVNFFCDNVREFINVPENFKSFDLHWVPEFKALEIYKKADLNFIHLPMPVWVSPKHRYFNHLENYGVTFIGSRDRLREALFAEVLKKGVHLELRGSGWGSSNATDTQLAKHNASILKTLSNQITDISHYGMIYWMRKIASKFGPEVDTSIFKKFIKDYPDNDEYIKVMQQSKISLGVNRYPSFKSPFGKPDTYSRLRDIEAPMMGACYLTEWTEGIEDLYNIGEEIEVYRSAEELIQKIEYLSSNRPKRLSMRCSGQKRALSELTICKSLDKISKILGL